MTRQEHLRFCKICNNQKFDLKQGIICKLTDKQADFEIECENYSENPVFKQNAIINAMENNNTSKGKRFLNYIIDNILIAILSLVIAFIIGIILFIKDPSKINQIDNISIIWEYLFSFVISTIYYTLFEAATGRSIAKFITGTKVVNENGEKPSFSDILLRSIYRFIPFDAISFLGSNDYGWHDSFSKTRVVNV